MGEQLDHLLKRKRSSFVEQLRSRLPAARTPALSKAKPERPARKLGRNERCWGGSGKKYKHCHWTSDQIRGS